MLSDEMNGRTCIVTRKSIDADGLIRFVLAPDGTVVPDLKRRLPGRGCWVTADRAHVDRAAAKDLFARALKAPAKVPPDLGATVDRLMSEAALGALGLARKAGSLVLGAAKVEAAAGAGKALFVLHAAEASEDGVRKIAGAIRAAAAAGNSGVAAYKLFSQAELSLALGGTNVIHAAVLADGAGRAALNRVTTLARFRSGGPAAEPWNRKLRADRGRAEDME